MKKNNRGITLIALLITIVLLLILATVTITEMKDTKLFSKTKAGGLKYKNAQVDENNLIEGLSDNVTKWTEAEKHVSDLKVGDFIEYNVEYLDIMDENLFFTKENGWRVLNPGEKDDKGNYNNVEIISTGCPITFFASVDDSNEVNSPWIGSLDDVKKYRKECKYGPKDDNAMAIRLAAGLRYNLDKLLTVTEEMDYSGDYDPVEVAKSTRKRIVTDGTELPGVVSIKKLFSIEGLSKDVTCPTLEIVKDTMNKKIGRKKYNLDTDLDIMSELPDGSRNPLYEYSKEEDPALGFWDIGYLNLGIYKPTNIGGGAFMLASPDSSEPKNLRVMGSISKNNVFGSERNIIFPLRPIVQLKDGIKVNKSTFKLTE